MKISILLHEHTHEHHGCWNFGTGAHENMIEHTVYEPFRNIVDLPPQTTPRSSRDPWDPGMGRSCNNFALHLGDAVKKHRHEAMVAAVES
jgi:hypothetical protein